MEKFALVCADTLASGTAKERIWLLKSAWEWGVNQYQLPANNPWAGIVDRFKPSPKQPIKPFTINELQAILSAFANSRDYKHYSDFVSFMANTGCRFGEAAGLRWKHLGASHKTVWIGESVSRGVRRSTKTGKARTVYLSPTIQAMLAARFEKLQPNIDDLIFPAPRGGAIDDQNFRPRAWKQILAKCSIEYRRPYALRHSAISHALANGVNTIALATNPQNPSFVRSSITSIFPANSANLTSVLPSTLSIFPANSANLVSVLLSTLCISSLISAFSPTSFVSTLAKPRRISSRKPITRSRSSLISVSVVGGIATGDGEICPYFTLSTLNQP